MPTGFQLINEFIVGFIRKTASRAPQIQDIQNVLVEIFGSKDEYPNLVLDLLIVSVENSVELSLGGIWEPYCRTNGVPAILFLNGITEQLGGFLCKNVFTITYDC